MSRLLCNAPGSFYGSLQVKSPGAHFQNATSLNLTQLAKDIGENGIFTVKALLNIMMCDLVMYLNVGKNMSDTQIIQTVDLILEDYMHFKPEDFKLCFNRMKKGHYGQLFDRFDGQLILSMLSQYDQERAEAIEDIHRSHNNQLKKQPAGESTPELQRILSSYQKHKNATAVSTGVVEPERKNINKGPVYEMHQRWIDQFHAIKQRQGNADKFIQRYGVIKNPWYKPGKDDRKTIPRRLDINTYLEHKQWQYNEFVIMSNRHYQKPKED